MISLPCRRSSSAATAALAANDNAPVRRKPVLVSYAWTWDPVNNVATQVINSTTTTFSQNSGSNQLSQSVTGATTTTVDTTSNGNIADFKIAGTPITSYTYNQANQIASATGPLGASGTYEYGFDGQRILKTPSSGYPITYQYGQAAKELLAENDLHSGQTADYIYMDPGKNSRPIGQVDPTSGNVYYTHTDRQGTPQAVTDSSAYVVWSASYNPFGDTSSFSGTLTTQSLRLPGQYFDPETGNNHNGFRDYSGTLTRYVQSDPIGLGGGMNTYQYVNGNPFKYTDRSGLDPCSSGSVLCGSGPQNCGTICQFLNPDGGDSDPDPIGPLSQIPFNVGGIPPAWQPLLFPQNGGGPGGNQPIPRNGGGGPGGNQPNCITNPQACSNVGPGGNNPPNGAGVNGGGGNSPLNSATNAIDAAGDAQTMAQGLGAMGDMPELGYASAFGHFTDFMQNPTRENLEAFKEAAADVVNPFFAIYHLGRRVFRIAPAY
jgi:RHS repeat-associated protein